MPRKPDAVVDALALSLAKASLTGEVGKGGWKVVEQAIDDDEEFEAFKYRFRGMARRLWRKLQQIDNPVQEAPKANGHLKRRPKPELSVVRGQV